MSLFDSPAKMNKSLDTYFVYFPHSSYLFHTGIKTRHRSAMMYVLGQAFMCDGFKDRDLSGTNVSKEMWETPSLVCCRDEHIALTPTSSFPMRNSFYFFSTWIVFCLVLFWWGCL